MTLRPLPGFDPLAVSWGGPDETVATECSYCDAPLGDPGDEDHEIPLMVWNEAGWCAQFCSACQRKWWGMERISEDEPADTSEDTVELGPCCICQTETGVRNITMLERRGLIPGHGWGCFVCDLPSDGASAVLCDACLDRVRNGHAKLVFACRGYPATEGRVPMDELPDGEFRHDVSKHAESDHG